MILGTLFAAAIALGIYLGWIALLEFVGSAPATLFDHLLIGSSGLFVAVILWCCFTYVVVRHRAGQPINVDAYSRTLAEESRYKITNEAEVDANANTNTNGGDCE